MDIQNWEDERLKQRERHKQSIVIAMRKRMVLTCLLTIGLLTACGGKTASDNESEATTLKTALPVESNEVTVKVLEREEFGHELVSNGKITADQQVNLSFETAGILANIYVKNCDFVRKGQKLAELDRFKLNNQMVQARNTLERAQLDLKEVLIGQGYPIDAQQDVPQEIMQLAKVKSGYNQALASYEMAVYEDEHATLTAPFDGVVANLFTKPYNAVNSSTAFCTLVGTRQMEADFMVLESELPMLRKGDRVAVVPYSNGRMKYEGRITEINPLVEENGMVRVKAAVNGEGWLFSGMNVRISVYRSLGEQVTIPKTAVVLRSGKQVVFTLKNGKAQWNYVHTGLENNTHYTLTEMEGMEVGDTVIVTGNLNLAHDAAVTVKAL